ncbi:MAG: hypothetical protein HC835_01615 [Oscillatoriales cyanobacterium RM2_1_1]|nr:hypothetical protein [Oscillatoriales cyanobacterium SM2_3_0]NJO44425.1 hypothetical protein [Oscillatoriales cyanobacterium RM2_1_1]
MFDLRLYRILRSGILLVGFVGFDRGALAIDATIKFSAPVVSLFFASLIIQEGSVKAAECPTDLNGLIQQLSADLPGYANRARLHYSASGLGQKPVYIITAKFQPLEPVPPDVQLLAENHSSGRANTPNVATIVTQERWYEQQQTLEIQRTYWLFLRPTDTGWELIQLLSKSSPYPGYRLFPEISDNTREFMAEAIRKWLQNCP